MRLPGLGPKTARRLWQELGITTVADLRAAAEAQQLREARRARREVGGEDPRRARQAAGGRGAARARCSGRRCRSCAPSRPSVAAHPAAVRGLDRRLGAALPRDGARPRPDRDRDRRAGAARRVLLAAVGRRGRGEGRRRRRPSSRRTGCASTCASSRRSRYGNLLQHFTGSKDHNVALREAAVRRGLSVSEYGITEVESGEVHCVRDRGGGLRVPRLRVDPARAARERRRARGGAQRRAAEARRAAATCAATCTRTRPGRTARTRSRRWSPARSRRATSTTRSATTRTGCATGGSSSRRAAIDALQRSTCRSRILKGIEVNIRAGGELDVADEDLATLDWVVASVHNALRQGSDRPRARGDGEPVRRLHRPRHEPQDRQARPVRASTSSA